MIYQIHEDKEKKVNKYKTCVYNLDSDVVICDICSDADDLGNMLIQMNDNNLIKLMNE